MAIRVIVADDHPMFVKGLTREFEYTGQIKLVGSAADGEEALQKIEDLKPDVALLDILMPNRSGIQVLQTLKERGCGIKVIFLTGSESKDTIYAAISAGAAGYLLKTASWDEVTRAIIKVANGETVLDPIVAGKLAGEVQAQATLSDAPLLTHREYEALRMMSEGKTATEIAREWGVEPTTVRTHLHNAKNKLGAATYGAAIGEAIRRGLIE